MPTMGDVTGGAPEYPPLADMVPSEAKGTASGFTRAQQRPGRERPALAIQKG